MIDIYTPEFIFGLLSTILIVVCMFLKTRENILLLKLGADVSWVLAFVVQGAISGTISMFFTAVRTFCGRNFVEYKSIGFCLWLLSSIITCYFWSGFYDIFSLLGLTFVTIAVYLKKAQRVKLFFILSSISWGFYGYFIGYFELIIFEFFITFAGFINMYLKAGETAKVLSQ
ncbi:inner membrane protein [Desulfuromusa kysingii]|uniref:Inner membrane protein n=1 Tax=Desulfuromusa kysingii TaxID=37625 RepID=A0A1H3VV07_9BACT|nr:YgjV family protein [Desulfuromusa kysingii]SDZ78606.1 inner membrane protein [Desulfuromusa kysingii]